MRIVNLNKSFIHQANKKTDRNFDAKKLDPIQMNLIRYGISTVREVSLVNTHFTTPNKTRLPDLRDTRHNIIFEHDTFKIHGELSDPNERTIKRNDDYKRAGFQLIIINEDLCKMLQLNESDLAVYLYYHKLMEKL